MSHKDVRPWLLFIVDRALVKNFNTSINDHWIHSHIHKYLIFLGIFPYENSHMDSTLIEA